MLLAMPKNEKHGSASVKLGEQKYTLKNGHNLKPLAVYVKSSGEKGRNMLKGLVKRDSRETKGLTFLFLS